ncbi:hypothetical protein [Persicobacter sp. CCB-QB2]|uniref:hypothetical protein n=1 Tax=Persicobacter sp. CCB-QB2 TaxID=1561025 RepID=UPI0006A99B0B|nr:hypothetical protein [Persicobacter sp. CCB-QB2]
MHLEQVKMKMRYSTPLTSVDHQVYREGFAKATFYYNNWQETLRSFVTNRHEDSGKLDMLLGDQDYDLWLEKQFIPAFPTYPMLKSLIVHQKKLSSSVKNLIFSKRNGASQTEIIKNYQDCVDDLNFCLDTVALIRKDISTPGSSQYLSTN